MVRLPTPSSPTRTGFLPFRQPRMCRMRSSSAVRPIRGQSGLTGTSFAETSAPDLTARSRGGVHSRVVVQPMLRELSGSLICVRLVAVRRTISLHAANRETCARCRCALSSNGRPLRLRMQEHAWIRYLKGDRSMSRSFRERSYSARFPCGSRLMRMFPKSVASRPYRLALSQATSVRFQSMGSRIVQLRSGRRR